MTALLGSNALSRKWRSGFALGCLGGCVLTLIIMVGLGFTVRQQPERFPGPLRSFYGARDVIVTNGAGLSLDQIQAIRGVRPTIQVTLTEADINSYLREHPEAVGLPRGYAAPRVQFRENNVRLGMRTRVLVFAVVIWISMEPYIEGGELKLSVTRVEAGRVELPGELRKIAETRVAELLSDRLGAAGLMPESVQVGDGVLIVAARLVPIEEP